MADHIMGFIGRKVDIIAQRIDICPTLELIKASYKYKGCVVGVFYLGIEYSQVGQVPWIEIKSFQQQSTESIRSSCSQMSLKKPEMLKAQSSLINGRNFYLLPNPTPAKAETWCNYQPSDLCYLQSQASPKSLECLFQTLPPQTFLFNSQSIEPIVKVDVTSRLYSADLYTISDRDHTRSQAVKLQIPSSW